MYTPYTRCWVCGTEICDRSSLSHYKEDRPDIVTEWEALLEAWDNWKKSAAAAAGRIFSYAFDARELDRSFSVAHFVNGLFRMIVVRTDDEILPDGYYLSGVGHMFGADKDGAYLLVPQNRNVAYIGHGSYQPDCEAVTPVPFPFFRRAEHATRYQDSAPSGYPIHARCWDLLESHVNGYNRLELVVDGLKKHWEREVEKCPTCNWFDDPWKGHDCWTGLFRQWFPDPVHNDQFKNTFSNAVAMTSRKKRKRRARLTARPRPKRPRGFRPLTVKHCLPGEIVYMILDYLETRDIGWCITLFGAKWAISHWKRTFCDLVFEAERRAPTTLNWKYLMRHVYEGDLLKRGTWLWNRQRILKILSPLEKYIREQLDGSNGT